MTASLAGALAIAAIALVLLGAIWVYRINQRVSAVPHGGNVYDALRRLDEDLATVEATVAALQPAVSSLGQRMPGAIRHAAVVTYDAHGDQRGNLSRSIALLNERRDGLVITLLVGRDETLFFTKMVRNGEGGEPLSPEEATAVVRATSS